MISAVLDTNVLASGSITPLGIPGQILQAWRRGEFTLVVSPEILDEVREVMTRPKLLERYERSLEDVDGFVGVLESNGQMVQPPGGGRWVAEDPDDDKFIAAGLAAGADYVVSADRHLLGLGRVEGLMMVSAARFLAILWETRAGSGR